MKGIIFNLAQQAVVDEHGYDVWDQLLDTTGIDGAYTAVGNYPDRELAALVDAAADLLDTSPKAVLRWIGRTSMPVLAERYPDFFAQPDARSFILTLNDVIHPEVRKLHPGADVPDFVFATRPDGRLSIEYQSERKMCGFAEGLILGAGDHFGEDIAIEQSRCMLDGADSCLLVCSFDAVRPVAAAG